MNNRNVYVTNVMGHDLKGLEKFLYGKGEIIPITEGKQNIFNTETLERRIEIELHNMQPDDYLAIVGNSVIAGLICAAVHSRFGQIRMLLWDHRDREYLERTVAFK